MKVDSAALHQRLIQACEVVKQYSATDSSRAVLILLDSLIEVYRTDLLNVSTDNLVYVQAAIRQTQAIRDVVADQTHDVPKI